MNSAQGLMRETYMTVAKLMVHLSTPNQILCLGNLLATLHLCDRIPDEATEC